MKGLYAARRPSDSHVMPLGLDGAGRLDGATRTTLARRVNERLKTEVLHEGRRRLLGRIIQFQAHRVAGEATGYRARVGRW
jgi:hypothetical protein